MSGYSDGARSRDAGMASAQQHRGADQDSAVIDRAIKHLAARGEPFSADDARRLLPQVAPQLLGARFQAAARRGQIERVGDVQTTHAEGRARRILTWRGTRSGTPPPAAGQPSPRVTTSPREFYAPTVRTAPRTATTMPPEPPHRESSADKAKRLLVLGAVVVRRADDDGRVLASVQGDNDLYRVQRTAGGDWSCSCPSGQYGGPCSHRYAVGLVTGHAA